MHSFFGTLGTNKSGLLKAFSSSMPILSRLFPTFFKKPITETVDGKEKNNTVDLLVNNDTELSLFQRLAKRVSWMIYIYI